MIRLKKLKISGFRGARFPLTLDFKSDCKSMAIFGENATGKSTITDAMEWFLFNEVGHLWREDCKKEALRNLKIPDDEESYVSTIFSKDKVEGVKELSSALRVQFSSKTDELEEFLSQASSERTILRNADITEFINKRKGDKRKEIANIIGFEKIQSFRNEIQSTLNALERDTAYTTAKQIVDERIARILELVGKIIQTEQEFYREINNQLEPFELEKLVTDLDSYQTSLQELKKKTNREEKITKQLKIKNLKKALDDFADLFSISNKNEESFLPSYKKLVQEKEKIKQLNLGDFLKKGQEVLKIGVPEEGKCPFCGNKVDMDKLKEEVGMRVQELEKNSKEYEAIKVKKNSYVSSLINISRSLSGLEEKWEDLDVPEEFKERIKEICSETTKISEAVAAKFESYGEIESDDKYKKRKGVLLKSLDEQSKKAEAEEKALELTDDEKQLVDVITKLENFKDAFFGYIKNLKTKQDYERQIKSLHLIFEEFVKVQNMALQEALDRMSMDIGKYYSKLHPGENVDEVKLSIVGDEGVEFEYLFGGEKRHPPMKYLSESHLNSLGIALFLSSVKLFNKTSQFFILDDVVTSFDVNHRRRLIRLLKEEFSEWQIVLLTHESFWFELIKKELGPEGWLFNNVEWDEENGIQLNPSAKDLRELINVKRNSGQSVGNDIRKLMERLLKEICESLEVKLAYRSNERNEERMPAELLGALRATLNKKCDSLKNHLIYSKLEADNLIGIKESHDRPESASSGDINVALEDIDEFNKLFRCDNCRTFVARSRFLEGQKKIFCRCNNKEVEWKK